ncbi:hypothetical protein HYR54_04085 [Candidatus Acetothermia bacterium]|nr:hypothetical protein [Candidatus Acetothermia bacterium]
MLGKSPLGKSRIISGIGVLLLVVAGGLAAALIKLPGAAAQAPQVKFVYSVNYVCNPPDEAVVPQTPDTPETKAQYKTVIDVQNPYGREVTLNRRVVVAGSPPSPPPQSVPADRTIPSGGVLEFGCSPFGEPLPGGHGLLILESLLDVNVSATYTNFVLIKKLEVVPGDQNVVGKVTHYDKYIFIRKARTGTGPEVAPNVPRGIPQDIILPSQPGVPIDPQAEVARATGVPRDEIQIIDSKYGVTATLAATQIQDEIALAIGSGISIDVEYIQPKRVEK